MGERERDTRTSPSLWPSCLVYLLIGRHARFDFSRFFSCAFVETPLSRYLLFATPRCQVVDEADNCSMTSQGLNAVVSHHCMQGCRWVAVSANVPTFTRTQPWRENINFDWRISVDPFYLLTNQPLSSASATVTDTIRNRLCFFNRANTAINILTTIHLGPDPSLRVIFY